MNLQDLANLAVLIGVPVAICQIFFAQRNNKINNELSGYPDFFFTPPNQCERFGVGYCSGGDYMPIVIDDCDGNKLLYMFNLVNCGKFAAKDVNICVINKQESYDISAINVDRWQRINHFSGYPLGQSSGDMIPIYIKPNDLELSDKDHNIYILLKYKSSYSHTIYKRVYECCIKNFTEYYILSKNNDDNYEAILTGYNKLNALTISRKSSDNEIVSAIRSDIDNKEQTISKNLHAVGLKQPVIIHDIKLIGECSSGQFNIDILKRQNNKHKKLDINNWLYDNINI